MSDHSAHSHSSDSEKSIWSAINTLIGVGIAAIVLFFGISFIYRGLAGPVAKAAVAKAASAEVLPTDLTLTPDSVNPMAFATKQFRVNAGKEITFTFDHNSPVPLPHNVVIGKQDSKAALDAAAMKVATDPAGMAKGYIPEDPAVLAHTKLVQPGTKETIKFTLPSPGDYPFMCTFPGHSITMNGIIKAE